jgi:hypothetical protein
LVPRAPGSADIQLDFGGVYTRLFVEVMAPEARDTVRLAAGEYRHWTLGPGRYIATYTPLAPLRPQAPLVWRSSNANCADVRMQLHCVLTERGSIILFASSPVRAAVRIDRRAQ